VEGPPLGQGVLDGCLDARRTEKGFQGVTVLHFPGRPDDPPGNASTSPGNQVLRLLCGP